MRFDQLVNGHEAEPNPGREKARRKVTSLGLLSKTLTQSPVIRWILPARIRRRDKDDLIFVGDDFIEIKEIKHGGHLDHVATKSDFDCRIVSVKVLGDAVDDEDDDDDDDSNFDIKLEDLEMSNGSFPETAKVPPQCLVLVLETQQLVFLFACEDAEGVVNFEMTSNIPLPAFPHLPQQLGKHLAVDPKSRAIAVAAAQDNVFLYSVEPMHEGAQWGLGVLPISHERPLARIPGVIQAMEFLYPPESDPEQVILLIIVIRDGKTSLLRVDWLYSAGIQSAHYHNPLPIAKGAPIPNLLIPIQSSAAFILTIGADVYIYTDILGGQPQCSKMGLPDCPPQYPGSSPILPRWAAWARPRRNEGPGQREDFLYLAREDGNVLYLVLNRRRPEEGAQVTQVSNFACHIDSAFSCYGKRSQNDFFAICASMSEGAIYNIMPLPESAAKMGSEVVSRLPNWTPTFDLVASKLSRSSDSSTRSKDALFMPGGRQPYGHLSEMRFGIQARSGARFPAFPSVIQLWTLPIEEHQELLILFTSPTDTRCWRVSPSTLINGVEDENRYITEVDEDIGVDVTSRTLAAAMVADDVVLQISEDGISLSQSGQRALLTEICSSESKNTAAAISDEYDIAVVAERKHGQSVIKLIHVIDDEDGIKIRNISTPVISEQEIVSAVISKSAFGLFVVLGTSDASLQFYGLDANRGLLFLLNHTIQEGGDMHNACEDLVVLADPQQHDSDQVQRLMLICGLRDGTLHSLELLFSQDEHFSIQSSQCFTLGFTSVKLRPDTITISKQNKNLVGRVAYATCGNGFFKIAWAGAGSKDLTISDVWITDAREPSFQQGAITSFAMVPSSDCIGPHLSQSLVVTSGNAGFITKTDSHPKAVPRSIPTQGTPNRLVYSQSFNCFIIVAAETSLHASSTNRGSESRSLRPLVRFKSSGQRDWDFVHELEPGSRIYCVTEWAYKDPAGKKYAFVVLGSGPIDDTSSAKSEIILLQPVMREGVVEQVRQKKLRVLGQAVYSLAPYGETGLIVCTNPWICMFEYQPSENRFTEMCRFKTTHPGVYVTTAPPLVHVSTSEDSLITLHYSRDENRFTLAGGDSEPRKTVFHLTLDIPYFPGSVSLPQSSSNGSSSPVPLNLNLLSTRDRHVVGQISASPTGRTHSNTMVTLFDGITSRSQTRIRQANIRPAWKAATVPGILEDRLVGTSVDGTITGFAVLEPALANRLRWVQRLCERNARICPMALRHCMNRFIGDVEEEDMLVLPPPGFGDASAEQRMTDPKEMHINGDILQRLVDRGGAALLHQMIEEEAQRKDRLGDWVRENMDSQLELVETLAQEVKMVLDRWW